MNPRSRLLFRPGFMKAQLGQRLLPLVALMTAASAATAAVDQEARIQISRQQSQLAQMQNTVKALDSWRVEAQADSAALRNRYDGLHEVQQELNQRFLTLREQQGSIADEWSALRDNHRQLATEFATVVAQLETVSQNQQRSEIKLAQIEGQTSGRGVVQLMNQIDSLNLDLNKLRGQVEVLSNSIDNAQKRQRDMYLDLDTRMRRIEQQDHAAAQKKNEQAMAALEERIKKLEQALAARASIPAPVNTASGSEAPAPAASAAATAAAATLAPATLSAVDSSAQRAYDAALSSYRVGDYQGAINAFQAFLRQHPRHGLAPNAQYWIGDAYFQLRDFRSAIDAQRLLIASYPDSAKAPDALLNIGSAELALGNATAARQAWEELSARHPGTESAEKARQRLSRLP
jgi:tol-pal system protein YbgF